VEKPFNLMTRKLLNRYIKIKTDITYTDTLSGKAS